MRKVAEFIMLVVGSTIVALVVSLFVAGVSSSGVALLELTHVFFWACFIVGVVGAVIATALLRFSVWYVLLAGVWTCLLLGGSLYGTNVYLTKKKTELDAANHPPTPVNRNPQAPPVPIVKTPKPKTPQVKIEQHGAGSGAVGGNLSVQPCSNSAVGGINIQQTVNCGTPQRTLTDKQKDLFASFFLGLPESVSLFVWEVAGADAGEFGDSIIAALASKRNRVPAWSHSLNPTTRQWKGLVILTPRGQLNIVSQLCEDLTSAQLTVSCYEQETLPPNRIQISVGVPD